MNRSTKAKATALLRAIQTFILNEIVPDDPKAQQEISEIFRQLFLLIDGSSRQGG